MHTHIHTHTQVGGEKVREKKKRDCPFVGSFLKCLGWDRLKPELGSLSKSPLWVAGT